MGKYCIAHYSIMTHLRTYELYMWIVDKKDVQHPLVQRRQIGQWQLVSYLFPW